jgi:hypothetical protein
LFLSIKNKYTVTHVAPFRGKALLGNVRDQHIR